MNISLSIGIGTLISLLIIRFGTKRIYGVPATWLTSGIAAIVAPIMMQILLPYLILAAIWVLMVLRITELSFFAGVGLQIVVYAIVLILCVRTERRGLRLDFRSAAVLAGATIITLAALNYASNFLWRLFA